VAGLRTVHVPYSGSAPAVAALLSGDVHILSLNPSALVPQALAGKVKILAQTSARRSPLLPDIPTFAEAGFPGLEADLWMAVMVPAGTPAAAIQRLHAELTRLIRDPAIKASLWDRQWVDPGGGDPADVTALMHREKQQWARTLDRAGMERPR
jgi:tripartite-type tricarboxylate transporter receptor subunit TctC